MNKRRGFKRLAIALGVPYFGWWALVAIMNYPHIDEYEKAYSKALSGNDLQDIQFKRTMLELSYGNFENAMMWGLIVPALLLILGLIAYWVYRGFKPKE